MECLELKDHPFFFGVQFHPEFQTNYFRPSPPFNKFIEISGRNIKNKIKTFEYFEDNLNNEVYGNYSKYYEGYLKKVEQINK